MKFVVLAAILILATDLLAGERGIPALLQSRRDASRLMAQIAALRAENATLAARIRALTSDPATIEGVARQTLGLVRPGEIVVTTARPSGDR
ncbi:MAG TPA: septum formation initiator family protein [Gemmatimonadaceae bacterium]|jgi:cell division protein FtsB|nr:septum formation initiator family protein [Gemmatimonadaceae bacterium]